MIRAAARLLLAPLLGVACWAAHGEDLGQVSALLEAGDPGLFAANRVHAVDGLAILTGHDRRTLVLAVPLMKDADGYSLCLLYDYARTDYLDPISASGLGDYDGNHDARNLGLGLRRLMTEKLEFEAVVGHSHALGPTNSAYAGVIYDVDSRFGLGADLGRISAPGQDDKRLRAFARFYF